MAKTEIGFTGEVHPAACPCHQGQFLVVVFQIHPALGRIPVGQQMFKNEDLANDGLEKTVLAVATSLIESVGLKVDEAARVTVAHGDQALAMEERLMETGTSDPADLH